MAKKLFVGGLSWGTTDDGLHEAFSRFGEIVEAKVITDRETGRSRGFGFVTFADEDGAQNAVAEMNNAKLDGRTIRVNEADNQAPKSRGGFRSGDRGPRRASYGHGE
ncbi:MAG: RNA-binding protein [Planctomycetota bacterium]